MLNYKVISQEHTLLDYFNEYQYILLLNINLSLCYVGNSNKGNRFNLVAVKSSTTIF